MPQIDIKKKQPVAIIEEIAPFFAENLFGSKTRVRLLNLFLEYPKRPFYVREITRKVDAQLNSVRRELQNLIDSTIVKVVEGKIIPTENDDKKKTEKKKYYIANEECPFFEEMRGMIKKMAILSNQTLVKELQEAGTLNLLLLSGKFIDNTDVASDILVVGDISEKKLQEAMQHLESQLAREVNYTYMPKDEFLYRLEVKDRFLVSLLQTDKVIMVNTLAFSI
jgi:hypothetical protein